MTGGGVDALGAGRRYAALGDSMPIDQYAGGPRRGAVSLQAPGAQVQVPLGRGHPAVVVAGRRAELALWTDSAALASAAVATTRSGSNST
jgi:hypothetical protein